MLKSRADGPLSAQPRPLSSRRPSTAAANCASHLLALCELMLASCTRTALRHARTALSTSSPSRSSPHLVSFLPPSATMSTWSRLVRFVPASGGTPLIGEPADPAQDVGLASFAGEPIEVETFTGTSILDPGERTGTKDKVKTILSPLAQSEVGTIRCIGLNVRPAPSPSSPLVLVRTCADPVLPRPQYLRHAEEVKMALPEVPVLFMKPSTSLADPFPAPTVIPKAFVQDKAADYESELVIVIGKAAKNVSEQDALDCVLGCVPPSPPRSLARSRCARPRRSQLARPAATRPPTTSLLVGRSLRSRSGATPSRSTAHVQSARPSSTRSRSGASPSSRSEESSTVRQCRRAGSSASLFVSSCRRR